MTVGYNGMNYKTQMFSEEILEKSGSRGKTKIKKNTEKYRRI